MQGNIDFSSRHFPATRLIMGNNENLNRARELVAKFQNDEDKIPDYDNFRALCSELFGANECEEKESIIENIFHRFSSSENYCKGNSTDLRRCFEQWVSTVLNPVNVLLIVDMQNDFIDGSLALRNCGSGDGTDVIEPINKLIQKGCWDKVIYSLDWHPENHISFYDNLHIREVHPESKISKESAKVLDTVLFKEPCVEQKLWPRHCVRDTWGAQLHKDLVIASGSEQVLKGQDPDKESYSVFGNINTNDSIKIVDILSKMHATDVYVCGLAYDVCVKETCLDGLRLGYRLALIDDCCRGVSDKGIVETKQLITGTGGLITTSDNVFSLINGKMRSLVMAQQGAKFLAHETNDINNYESKSLV